jgi:hypothetical protein
MEFSHFFCRVSHFRAIFSHLFSILGIAENACGTGISAFSSLSRGNSRGFPIIFPISGGDVGRQVRCKLRSPPPSPIQGPGRKPAYAGFEWLTMVRRSPEHAEETLGGDLVLELGGH